jgi:hypothetical protein
VSTPRAPLRSTLDRLARDLTEAVLGAVRTAFAEALDERRGSSSVPATRTRAPRTADGSRTTSPSPRRPSARLGVPAQLELALPTAATFPDASIVDPLAVLGIVAHRNAPSATDDGVQTAARPVEPPPASSREPRRAARPRVPTAALDAPVAPVRAIPPPARPGEEVVQGAGGVFVLRRRRNVVASA